MPMDIHLLKMIFFTITSILCLSLYTINVISGLNILHKGMVALDPLKYMFVIMTTLSSGFTTLAGIDWLLYNQFMQLDSSTNLLWVFHHLSHSFIIYTLHAHIYEKYINQKNKLLGTETV